MPAKGKRVRGEQGNLELEAALVPLENTKSVATEDESSDVAATNDEIATAQIDVAVETKKNGSRKRAPPKRQRQFFKGSRYGNSQEVKAAVVDTDKENCTTDAQEGNHSSAENPAKRRRGRLPEADAPAVAEDVAESTTTVKAKAVKGRGGKRGMQKSDETNNSDPETKEDEEVKTVPEQAEEPGKKVGKKPAKGRGGRKNAAKPPKDEEHSPKSEDAGVITMEPEQIEKHVAKAFKGRGGKRNAAEQPKDEIPPLSVEDDVKESGGSSSDDFEPAKEAVIKKKVADKSPKGRAKKKGATKAQETEEVPSLPEDEIPAQNSESAMEETDATDADNAKKANRAGGRKRGQQAGKQKNGAPKGDEPSDKKPKADDEGSSESFECDKQNKKGETWNLKISTWNVAGLRAWVKKEGLEIFSKEDPDIICLQETKCPEDKVPAEAKIEGYHTYWANGDGSKSGYAGVALYSKEKPINVSYGIGEPEHDADGRVICAEYDKFYLVTTYVPNSGQGLKTLPKRMKWDGSFRKFLKDLDEKKPVILCGDLNVAHAEIDLANPKTNVKNAGFTPEERANMTTLLSEGFVDTYRVLYPSKTGAYTFWSYLGNARSRNTGWRLDYFVVSEKIADSVCDVAIRNKILGSDHCPVTLFIHV